MTQWIVVQVAGLDADDDHHQYLAAPGEGSAWGPKLRDAYRFKSSAAAWREIGRLAQEHRGRPDWRYTVRRVVTVRERLTAKNRRLRFALANATAILVQYIGEEHGVIKNARELLVESAAIGSPKGER